MEVIGTTHLRFGYKWIVEKEDGLYLPFIGQNGQRIKHDPNFVPKGEDQYCHCFATINHALDYLKTPDYNWDMLEPNETEIDLTLYTVTTFGDHNRLVGLYQDFMMISFEKVIAIKRTYGYRKVLYSRTKNPHNSPYTRLERRF